MSDPRLLGLTLMAISIVAFLGTTSQQLPAAVFFPALALFLIGAFQFLRSNHEASSREDARIRRARNAGLRPNRNAETLAERQARSPETGVPRPTADASTSGSADTAHPGAQPNALAIDVEEGDLQVETDLSFPVEVQSADALADQLGKLSRLLEQGILTQEEYAVAKAKLLT